MNEGRLFKRKENEYGETNYKNRFINCSKYSL